MNQELNFLGILKGNLFLQFKNSFKKMTIDESQLFKEYDTKLNPLFCHFCFNDFIN